MEKQEMDSGFKDHKMQELTFRYLCRRTSPQKRLDSASAFRLQGKIPYSRWSLIAAR